MPNAALDRFEDRCLDLFADHPDRAAEMHAVLLAAGRRRLRRARPNVRRRIRAGLDAVDRAYATFRTQEQAA